MGENDGVYATIGRIKPGIQQCVVSNTDQIHWQAIKQLPTMKMFFSNQNLLLRSHAVGACKPDQAIYREALKRLRVFGIDICQVLYIDDVPEYRRAFEEMGGKTLNYNCSQEPLANLNEGLKIFGVFND